MATQRVLIVDDDDAVRLTLAKVMQKNDYDVVAASNVAEALQQITSNRFDVLISDLHMPGAADGLTVISAMRHANPSAITFLLSAHPDLHAAANAILMQADEILVKPMEVTALLQVVQDRLARGPSAIRVVESVATILERSISIIVEAWIQKVEAEPALAIIPLERELRIAYVPTILADLVTRLRSPTPLGNPALQSHAAYEHGLLRRRERYSAAMIVTESRLLQASIFQTLQNNLNAINFSLLLNQIMVIADEVASQLSQSMESYKAESVVDLLSN
jgi:CheY-like chemotaxis protein